MLAAATGAQCEALPHQHFVNSKRLVTEINRERSQCPAEGHAKGCNPQREGFFRLAEKMKRKQNGRGTGESVGHERYEGCVLRFDFHLPRTHVCQPKFLTVCEI